MFSRNQYLYIICKCRYSNSTRCIKVHEGDTSTGWWIFDTQYFWCNDADMFHLVYTASSHHISLNQNLLSSARRLNVPIEAMLAILLNLFREYWIMRESRLGLHLHGAISLPNAKTHTLLNMWLREYDILKDFKALLQFDIFYRVLALNYSYIHLWRGIYSQN